MKTANKGSEKDKSGDRRLAPVERSSQNRATQEHDRTSSVPGLEPVDIPALIARRRPHQQQERKEKRSPRGCGGNCGFFGGIALLIVVLTGAVITLIAVNVVTGFLDEPWNNLKDLFGFESKPAHVTDVTVIVEGIREQALLTALEGRETIWVTSVKERPGILADAELRIRYTGQVNLGYDLSQISEADIVVETDRVIVTLPPLQYTLCALHDPQVEKWNCGTNVVGSGNCGSTLNEMQVQAHAEGIAQLLAVAQEQQWGDEAYLSAQKTLAQLITGMGYENIEFRANPNIGPSHESCLGSVQSTPHP